MALYVPTNDEIAAKAAELGTDLTAPGARGRVAKAIAAERAAAEDDAKAAKAKPAAELLARNISTVPGGRVIVETYWLADRPAGSTTEGEPR